MWTGQLNYLIAWLKHRIKMLLISSSYQDIRLSVKYSQQDILNIGSTFRE